MYWIDYCQNQHNVGALQVTSHWASPILWTWSNYHYSRTKLQSCLQQQMLTFYYQLWYLKYLKILSANFCWLCSIEQTAFQYKCNLFTLCGRSLINAIIFLILLFVLCDLLYCKLYFQLIATALSLTTKLALFCNYFLIQ